jgi:hypothetical protein
MSVRRASVGALVLVGATLAAVPDAQGQVFGTFPWQMQPYCNVVTLTLTSTPAGFTLDGTDDQCGALNKASTVGIAAFNAGGNVTLSFTIVTAPTGKPIHVSAVVSPANGSGTWTDSVGNTGTFAFFGAVAGLPPRPAPPSGLAPASITTVELAPNAVTGATVANGSLSVSDLADGPRAAGLGGSQNLALSTTPLVLRTITVSAPVSGRVIAYASGSFRFSDASAINEGVQCAIQTQTTVVDTLNRFLAGDGAAATAVYAPFGATRLFDVTPGPLVLNLVCREDSGTISVENSHLTAVFIAQ